MSDAINTDGFYYLASPYSSGGRIAEITSNVKRQAELGNRASESNRFAGGLLARGVFTYQAIWSTHRIAAARQLPIEHEYWTALNKAFIDPSLGVIVCDMAGWKKSRGVNQEINYARSLNKPVYLCEAFTCRLRLLE